MASKQIQQGSTPAPSQPQQQGTPMPQPQAGKPVYTDWASI
ncbi:hypothetical protein [Pseudogemmobacter blasticus]|nr:hypothetical protein [Fuscovulum blasticum]